MSDQSNVIAKWLQGRAQSWTELQSRLHAVQAQKESTLESTAQIVQGYRSLVRDLSLARRAAPNSKVTRYLEALAMEYHELIHGPARNLRADLVHFLAFKLPENLRALRPKLFMTTAIFLVSAMLGWLLVSYAPETASLFASEEMINGVQQGKLWTDGLINIMPSSVLSLGIMTNNITVSLTAFALGAFYGLGTLYIMVLNGFMLGSMFAFTAQHGLAGRLFEFIVAHGIVELSVICLAGAAGIALGEALIRPGYVTRSRAFQNAVGKSFSIIVVGCLFLIGAGLVEGYISPDPRFPLVTRCIVGVGFGAIFWLTITGALWRTSKSKNPRSRT